MNDLYFWITWLQHVAKFYIPDRVYAAADHWDDMQLPCQSTREGTQGTTETRGRIKVMWGLILGLRSANERRRYFVTTSFICWAHA